MSAPEVGYDIPAFIGMAETEIETPCLIVDLDAFERNVAKMRDFCATAGVRLRAHGKMHKSADVANYLIEAGGSVGICCQKTAEAHAFARAGIDDILITNQVRGPRKIARLAEIAKSARLIVCCDDIANVAELSAAAAAQGVIIEVLVEIDCGAGRCGVTDAAEAVAIARAVEAAPGLKFSGIQAYQGAMQHIRKHADRKAEFDSALVLVKETIAALKAEGIACPTVSGGGTGSFAFEADSGVYTELQCGSYAFMDADYGRVLDSEGARFDRGEWENALFILTSVMSHVKPDQAVCDAGLKAQSVDSGLPLIFGRDDVEYVQCSDEHGVIEDPKGALKVNDRLRLVPGHCDPTCNLHDWYVGVRNGRVEALWPVTARGLSF